jgi:quercetin dioxygenase-like cupin family protein
MAGSEASYAVKKRVTVAEAPNLRVRELALAEGQCVPWHYHTTITDTFFCMEGPMVVHTRDAAQRTVLQPGSKFAVAPGMPHRVTGLDDGACRFMIVQGVGVYDYVPVRD